MAFRRCLLAAVAGAASLAAQQSAATAQELLGLLPDDSLLVLEVADPRTAVAELRHAIGGVPDDLRQLLGFSAWAGLGALWLATGGDPEAFAGTLAGGGAVAAVVPAAAGPRAVALLRPGDADAAEAWFGRHAASTPRARCGELLVVGSDRDAVAALAARVSPAGPRSRWSGIDLGSPAAVRGACDLGRLRALAGTAAKAFDQHDAPARVLLLPLLHAATSAELVTLALHGGERLTLQARAAVTAREGALGGLFAPAPAAGGVALPADGLLYLRLDRSLRALLAQPERFLAPAEVLAVRGFLSIADAVDGADSSFVDDLLGGLAEPLALHVLPVTPPLDGPPPRLQLPGLAVAARMVGPRVESLLGRVAQVFVLIANAERQQRGQPPFALRAHATATGRGFVAEPPYWRGPGAPPIEQGLSPTLWFENGHAVLASTQAAALALAAATWAGEQEPRQGDLLLLRGPALAQTLGASREALETARMLDEGETPAMAARFFDVLCAVARALREVSLRVADDGRCTTVELILERAR
jgi:hypothetical protein